jgi:hypothetical protein
MKTGRYSSNDYAEARAMDSTMKAGSGGIMNDPSRMSYLML